MARAVRSVLAVGLVAVAGIVGGCGGDDGGGDGDGGGGAPPSDAPEAQIFADTCGSCHTFEPAGTTGQVGPPLTNTPLDAAAIAQQIEEGGGGMPPGLLEGEERQQVAEWVAANAGD